MLRNLLSTILVLSMNVANADDWDHYGSDAGGSQFSSSDQINTTNVHKLSEAWRYRTGDLQSKPTAIEESALEVTPIIIEDQLIFCTPFNEVISIDPVTGEEQWRFDPRIGLDQDPANQYVCRGVSYWRGNPGSEICSDRIFMGTNDRRLIALDRRTGTPCPDFGEAGQVRIDPGMTLAWEGEFQITSPPAILDDLVITGSAISDNLRADAPRGTVRAYNAVSGAHEWQFDPIQPVAGEWQDGSDTRTGHANVWAPISVDTDRKLVFLPTSSPSPDFFGGERPGDNRYANSIVVLDGTTGKVRWHFQTVHHDVFDYDLPAQPTLTQLQRNGEPIDAVVVPTKTGLIFVFDRTTGEPLFDIVEQPVPQTDVPGEVTSPTQPVPVAPPALSETNVTEEDMWGLLGVDKIACQRAFREYRNDGMFTPPSIQGSVEVPFTGGGINWGGIAVHPSNGLAYVNTNNAIHIIRLFPAEQFEVLKQTLKGEISPQLGTDYGMKRDLLLSPLFGLIGVDIPCNKPPWGQLSAVDLNTGEIMWQSTLGTTEDVAPFGVALNTGTPNFGGPMLTAGGLVFIAATMDHYLRAFDAGSGEELWKGRLPTGGQATPMTYERNGRQYVVIAAGGHSRAGVPPGDWIIAFTLPDGTNKEKP